MRKFLLLFLVFTAFAWAQPEEPRPEAPADTQNVVDQPVEPVEETVAEETVPEEVVPEGDEIERAENASMDLIDTFIAGGIFMWPLLLSALVGIAITVERFLSYKKIQIDLGDFLEKIGGFIRKGDIKGAEDLCSRTRGPVPSIMQAGLSRSDKGLETVERAVNTAGAIEMSFLEKGIVGLASVTSIAPMLGFLGTVSGMIHAFAAIAAAKNVEASLVASGISEALITTAAGLMIAIPIQMAHNYFIGKVGKYVVEMEEASIFLLDKLSDMEHLKQL